MPTTTDLLGLAIDKNPVDFADTFNQIMMQKAHDAIESKRIEVAQNVYGEEPDLDDDAVDFDDDDINLDDEDELDLDLDDLDIDLDDLDLEGIIDAEDA